MKYIKKHALDAAVVVVSITVGTVIWAQLGPEIALSFLSIPAALLISKWFGDLAGTKAARKYEEQKAGTARIIALQALLNELEIIQGMADQNAELASSRRDNAVVLKMPTTALETAFLSGESRLLQEWSNESAELLILVRDYLTEAHSINLLVESYLALLGGLSSEESGWRRDVVSSIGSRSQKVLQILPEIEDCLQRELDNYSS